MEINAIKEGLPVYDSELRNMGDGVVVLIDEQNDLVEVDFNDISEIVQYSINSANKYLEPLPNENN